MQRRTARLLGALMALTLIAAACGDDDDATTTQQPEQSEDAAGAQEGTAGDGEDMASDDAENGGDMDDMDGDDVADMTDADEMEGDRHHDHGDGIEVPAGMAVPQVSIAVQPDPKSGQNLQVTLADFTIAPERASTEPVDGEGHMHLYVNGEREMRFYNEWLHLSLPPGDHLVEVELSANNHMPYTVDGERILGSATVVVPEPTGQAGHSHTDPIEVTADPPPTVEIAVTEDPKAGWNLQIELDNYRLAPENASTEPIEGEGHMHLYIDGEKIGRLYGKWWHIAALTEGDHEVVVELSANNHSPYTLDGEPIIASTTVSVSADRATEADHGHDDADDMEHGDDMGHGDDGDAVADADVVIDVGFDGDEVTVEDDRVDVDRGSTVAIVVTSDVAEHVHVHGYDLFVDVGPGQPATLTFEADIPGVFEIEFEDSGTFIAEIAVQ